MPRQFGIFYPRGYVVVALRSAEAAKQLRRALLEGGYADDDVQLMSMERVLEGASADLEQLTPLVRALGSETEATESHLAGPGHPAADERGPASRLREGAEVRPVHRHGFVVPLG
ncbi:MAG TPA: hypothetical protein VF061_07500 [Gemmatimonadales bacterium]